MNAQTTPRFEPMTIGMILDTTVRLYLHNFSLMIGITALAYLPYLILLLVSTFVASLQGQNATVFAVVGVGTSLLWFLIAQPLSIGAATYAISERYLHRQSSALDAIQAAWKRYGTLLGAQCVAGLVIAGGFMLFIIPGTRWMLSYALIGPAVILETGNAKESRQRSWSLVAGHRKKVFGVMLVVWVLTFVVTTAVQATLGLLLGLESVSGQLVTQAITQLASYVVIPFAIIANVLLYYDLRMRKEGFDLEMLSLALSRQ